MYQFGWVGPSIEEPAYEAFATSPDSPILDMRMIDWDAVAAANNSDADPKGKRFVFWDSVIKLTGKHLPNTNQLLGDCVGASTEMELEYMLADNIVRSGKLELYRPIFRPWLYGAGRVLIGKNRIRGDGSLISWQYDACQKFGILAEDEEGLPAYSTSVGRQWGSSEATLRPWIEKAAQNKIEKYIEIKSFEDAAKATIISKLGICIASMQGFDMKLRQDSGNNCSWFVPSGSWSHQLHSGGVDYNMRAPRIFIGNQWGYSAHKGQSDGPDGGGWVSADFFDKWVRQSGCYCLAMVNFNAWRMMAPNLSMR